MPVRDPARVPQGSRKEPVWTLHEDPAGILQAVLGHQLVEVAGRAPHCGPNRKVLACWFAAFHNISPPPAAAVGPHPAQEDHCPKGVHYVSFHSTGHQHISSDVGPGGQGVVTALCTGARYVGCTYADPARVGPSVHECPIMGAHPPTLLKAS